MIFANSINSFIASNGRMFKQVQISIHCHVALVNNGDALNKQDLFYSLMFE